ncbi:MAG: alpha/beta hydrolase, partial [Acidimicrobiia bacterium]
EALERVRQMYRDLRPSGEEPTVHDWRKQFEVMCGEFPVPPGTTVDEVDAGGVPALWVRAPGVMGDERTVVFFHSGGYVMGRAKDYRQFGSALSFAAGARVLLVDYRLAPEHPFPAGMEDGLAAYRWALTQTDPSRIVVAGDSAGGGMTLAVLVAQRDSGGTLPAVGVCISPWADLAAEGHSMTTRSDVDPIVQRELVLTLAAAYLGEGKDPKSTPLASPLYADLAGLPPMLIVVGDAETLLDDSIRLEAKILDAGGWVELDVAEDMPHVYPLFNPILPEGMQAIGRIGNFIRFRTSG